MVDIKYIQACFMDFDDTILVRTRRAPNLDYFEYMMKGDSSIFNRDNRAIGRGIQDFIRQCRNNGIKLYTLTCAKSNMMYRAEMKWLDETFGVGTFSDVFITSTREYKVKLIEYWHGAYHIPKANILLVDDIPEITDMAFNDGFQVASPQEIAIEFG